MVLRQVGNRIGFISLIKPLNISPGNKVGFISQPGNKTHFIPQLKKIFNLKCSKPMMFPTWRKVLYRRLRKGFYRLGNFSIPRANALGIENLPRL